MAIFVCFLFFLSDHPDSGALNTPYESTNCLEGC